MSRSDTMDRNATPRQTQPGGRDDARQAAAEAGDHVQKAASAATEAAELSYDELRAQVETLKADLMGLAEATRSAGAQTARRAYAGARHAGQKAATAAEDGYDTNGARC